MLRSVFTKSLWDQRRGILVWSLAIAGVGGLYAAFYPSMQNPAMAAAIAAFPPEVLEALGLADIASPAGYLGSTTYGLLGPILLIIFVATLGVRAVAGDEEGGRLDVLLAHPVERTSVVLQRAGAMAVAAAFAGAVLLATMLAISGPAEFASIGVANLAAASIQLVLLGLVFGAIGLAVGALTGSRSLAWAAVATAAVVSYLANTFAPGIEVLRWAQTISPFHYYSGGRPLAYGLQVGDALVLAAVVVALTVSSVLGFQRRDVGR